jgi:hypothetical protein
VQPQPKLTKRQRTIVGGTLGVIAVVAFVLWDRLLSGPLERFDFMDGHSAIAYYVEYAPISYERREYTWKEASFDALRERSGAELRKDGFEIRLTGRDGTSWAGPNGINVMINKGRAMPCAPPSFEKGWVTVVVEKVLPNNLMLHIKLGFSGCGQ